MAEDPNTSQKDVPLKGFAEWLDYHMVCGTRPEGRLQPVTGAVFHWTNDALAKAIGSSESSVRGWRRGARPPKSILRIEIAFFGEDEDKDTQISYRWRMELRQAHAKAFDAVYGSPEQKSSVDRDDTTQKILLGRGGTVNPIYYNVDFKIPRYFKGREDDLRGMENILQREIGRPTIVALYGMPGIGKTVLAHSYAAKHARSYHTIWHINSQVSFSIISGLISLGVRSGWLEDEFSKEDESVKEVIKQINSSGGGVLLIYDDAADAKLIAPYLPSWGGAHVIITSNDYVWRRIAEPQYIGCWDEEIGSDFLRERSGKIGDSVEASRRLSTILGGLPLAHEQAAAYCEIEEVSLGDYILLFNSHPTILLANEESAPLDYGRTVATTFTIAIDAAVRKHRASGWLISRLAVFASEPIPIVPMLNGIAARRILIDDSLLDGGLEKALKALRSYALIEKRMYSDKVNPKISIDVYLVHRLIRAIALLKLSDVERREFITYMLHFFSTIIPINMEHDQRNWLTFRTVEPHVRDFLHENFMNLVESGPEFVVRILIGTSSYYEDAEEDFEVSLRYLEQAFDVSGRKPQSNAMQKLHIIVCSNMGLLASRLGFFDEALNFIEIARLEASIVYPDDHIEVATIYDNIATVLFDKEDYENAAIFCTIAYNILMSHIPDRDLFLSSINKDNIQIGRKLASCISCMGEIARQLENYDEAIELLVTALLLSKMFNGDSSIQSASIALGLASALLELERVDFAKEGFEFALKVYEEIYGMESDICESIRAILRSIK